MIPPSNALQLTRQQRGAIGSLYTLWLYAFTPATSSGRVTELFR